MFTKIDLDNSSIFYSHHNTLLRNYIFTYINHINRVKSEIQVQIYFYSKEVKFVVKVLGEEDMLFDTYRDADLYAIKKIFDIKIKLEEETKEIKIYEERKSRRKNEKNNL